MTSIVLSLSMYGAARIHFLPVTPLPHSPSPPVKALPPLGDLLEDPGPPPANAYDLGALANALEVLFPRSLYPPPSTPPPQCPPVTGADSKGLKED